MTALTPTQLDELTWSVDADGLDGLAVRTLVRAARAAGISPVAVDVLADPGQPAVARLRAFGVVTTALASHDGHPHPAARQPAA